MKKFIGILIVLAVGLGIFFAFKDKEVEKANVNPIEDYSYYKPSEYGLEFLHPKSWGVNLEEGNKTCPEEDTYRTADTLNTFDWDYSFGENKLPESESFIRSGIHTYELDPDKLNGCGDDFILKLARRETDPRTLSSVRLEPLINENGLWGIYNPEASRLNTEGRVQYTFFVPENNRIHVIQPYFSFVPVFDSKELKELDGKFEGDMTKYLALGKTSKNIRALMEEFKNIAGSVKFSTEFGTGDPISAPSQVGYFIERVRQQIILKRGGIPKSEGYTGFMVLDTFPGVTPTDLDRVPTAYGNYEVKDGKLYFTGNAPSNAGDLGTTGMTVLLRNISNRLSLPQENTKDINEILRKISL